MNQCSVCSAELTGSGIRCHSCGGYPTIAHSILKQLPLRLDLFELFPVTALTALAFYLSVGGQKVFKGNLLED